MTSCEDILNQISAIGQSRNMTVIKINSFRSLSQILLTARTSCLLDNFLYGPLYNELAKNRTKRLVFDTGHTNGDGRTRGLHISPHSFVPS